jgi:hypothetical protein
MVTLTGGCHFCQEETPYSFEFTTYVDKIVEAKLKFKMNKNGKLGDCIADKTILNAPIPLTKILRARYHDRYCWR